VRVKSEPSYLVSIYKSDLSRIDTLSNGQQLWLGIVLDSKKILDFYLENKDKSTNRDCEFVYIKIINKIRELFGTLENYKIIIPVQEIMNELLEFKSKQLPKKQTILFEVFETIPDNYQSILFDLIALLWILPFHILEIYNSELIKNNKLPSIANLVGFISLMNSVYEIKKAQDRMLDSKNLLIEGFLGYTTFFAYKYRNRGLDYEDIIQEGNIGLIKAVERFDVRKGGKFKTYALWWIKQAITRAIANDSRIIRFPVHLHDRIEKITIAQNMFKREHLKDPSISTLSELCGISHEEIKNLLFVSMKIISLESLEICETNLTEENKFTYFDPGKLPCQDCPWTLNNSNISFDSINLDFETPICVEIRSINDRNYLKNLGNNLLNTISINRNEDGLDLVFGKNLRNAIDYELSNLSPRQKLIIEFRHGLNSGEKMTLEEIAIKLGVTRERIRQIETQAILRLRRSSLRKYSKI
jgi:RNA polymerase sigma factor (sigma-70 family)